MDGKSASYVLPIIETGIPLPAKQVIFPLYRKIEVQAWAIYDSYKANGISLPRAIQIAVARYLDNPEHGLWHWRTPDHARPYIPKEVRASGNVSPEWMLPRAKADHPIVKTLRARMSINKNC